MLTDLVACCVFIDSPRVSFYVCTMCIDISSYSFRSIYWHCVSEWNLEYMDKWNTEEQDIKHNYRQHRTGNRVRISRGILCIWTKHCNCVVYRANIIRLIVLWIKRVRALIHLICQPSPKWANGLSSDPGWWMMWRGVGTDAQTPGTHRRVHKIVIHALPCKRVRSPLSISEYKWPFFLSISK